MIRKLLALNAFVSKEGFLSGGERGISPSRLFLLRDFGPSMIREVNHIENGMPIPKTNRICAKFILIAAPIQNQAIIMKLIAIRSLSNNFILFSHLIRNLSLSLLDWLGLLFHPRHERPGILGGPRRITPVAHLIIGEPAATERRGYALPY
ncbi:hypothetical protein V6R97_01730 [Chromohalobacter salexigens]|uniref:hypothetical protein n=1 Tax=Chromohalobacter israelensis TaxID=141390 RepID=UPI0032E8FC47